MNTNEFYEALDLLVKEKGISADHVLTQIKKAIQVACKNAYNGNDDVITIMDKDNNIFDVRLQKEVVEEVFDPDREISLNDARSIDANVNFGDKVGIQLDPMQFGRIAVQTARSIIRQGIKDSEKNKIFEEFQSKKHEVVSTVIEKIDTTNGNFILKFGKAEAILPKSEQIGIKSAKEGDSIKVYFADVKETEKGPRAILSRKNSDFVKRLFETEIPEIYDGTIEIKSVSREAGSRTKLAVISKDSQVDAIGACIGTRGSRIGNILEELGDEKIDIIEYNEDPAKYVAAALAPAKVIKVTINPNTNKECRATVPDNQLSLAIGNKGQNARLAARLTGWKIDIRPESGFYGEENDDYSELNLNSDDMNDSDNINLENIDNIINNDNLQETSEELEVQE